MMARPYLNKKVRWGLEILLGHIEETYSDIREEADSGVRDEDYADALEEAILYLNKIVYRSK